MPGHNSSLFVLGVMILWFGWYGFNPGSQLALIGGSNAVANAAVTTTLAPAASAMSALLTQGIVTYVKTSKPRPSLYMYTSITCCTSMCCWLTHCEILFTELQHNAVL